MCMSHDHQHYRFDTLNSKNMTKVLNDNIYVICHMTTDMASHDHQHV